MELVVMFCAVCHRGKVPHSVALLLFCLNISNLKKMIFSNDDH